jgi:hypothetical protein
MPVSVVRTLEDEEAWERAKDVAATEYPDAAGSNYWRMVMGIYKKMTHYTAKSEHGRHDPTWRMTR